MKKLGSALTVAVASLASAAAVAVPSAQVSVKAIHRAGKIVYSYTVKNTGTDPISSLWIGGRADNNGHFYYELQQWPKTRANSFFVAVDSGAAPTGWGALVLSPDESDTSVIEFTDLFAHKKKWPGWVPGQDEPQQSASANYIAPGETRTGFEVAVDTRDINYMQWATVFNEKSEAYVASIVNPDQQAPRVDGNVNPTLEGTKYLVETNFTVSDNVDPSPKVTYTLSRTDEATGGNYEKLPAPANWKRFYVDAIPGKHYWIEVEAEDASGNLTRSGGSFVVPATTAKKGK